MGIPQHLNSGTLQGEKAAFPFKNFTHKKNLKKKNKKNIFSEVFSSSPCFCLEYLSITKESGGMFQMEPLSWPKESALGVPDCLYGNGYDYDSPLRISRRPIVCLVSLQGGGGEWYWEL